MNYKNDIFVSVSMYCFFINSLAREYQLREEPTMTLANARSCGVSVAYLMVTLALISAPMPSVLAQPSNVAIQPGYSMTAVATGLNFPTPMTPFGAALLGTEEGPARSPPAAQRVANNGHA